jgi:hypothetical protein
MESIINPLLFEVSSRPIVTTLTTGTATLLASQLYQISKKNGTILFSSMDITKP